MWSIEYINDDSCLVGTDRDRRGHDLLHPPTAKKQEARKVSRQTKCEEGKWRRAA